MSRDDAGSLVIAFDDVDRLSTSVRTHTEFVRSCIGHLARTAGDPDFAVSLPLSPVTGAQAGSAVAVAMGGLAVHVMAAEGMAVISATVVSTYRLMEESLALAASELGGVGGVVGSSIFEGVGAVSAGVVSFGSTAVLVGTVAISLRIAVDSFIAGFADEFIDSLGPGLQKTIKEYATHPELLIGGGGLFGMLFGANTGESFAMSDAFARGILRFESSLGVVGPFFDDILRGVIACGNNLGFFIDRDAELGPSGLSEEELARRAKQQAAASSSAIYGIKGALVLDDANRIVPSDVASLFASGRQIDHIGKEGFATIRILTCTDADGHVTGYTVQIPSTQSALPWREGAPNDLTTDLHAMVAGSQTALARAVLDAMRANGIPSGPDGPPILISGFSLGGITAAAIASADTGFNIQNVITAGAPIGSFNIPDKVGVLAFEANQDPVWALDGRENPPGWTTIRQDAFALAVESPQRTIGSEVAHDLNRYARMAAANLPLGTDVLGRYFRGDLTVADYYAKERQSAQP